MTSLGASDDRKKNLRNSQSKGLKRKSFGKLVPKTAPNEAKRDSISLNTTSVSMNLKSLDEVRDSGPVNRY